MPAFFMLSGLSALLWVERGPRRMLRNRYERLLLPRTDDGIATGYFFIVVLTPVFGGEPIASEEVLSI